MFARISASRTKPILSFAGGKEDESGTTTILSCCDHVLVSFFSQVAATPLRLVCKDLGKVFKVPSEKPEPYKQTMSVLEMTQTSRSGSFYHECFEAAKPEFKTAFTYIFTLRKIHRNPNNIFMNDFTFRGILRDIFVALQKYKNHQAVIHGIPGGIHIVDSSHFEDDIWNAMSLHLYVNQMSSPSMGLNPHAGQIMQEWFESLPLQKALRR
jgi:hypothetical protein